MLNWNNIKIVLDYWYKEIADELYKRLDLKISSVKKEEEKLTKKLEWLDIKAKNYKQLKVDIEQEIESLLQWLWHQNKWYIRKKYRKISYFDLYEDIKEYYYITISKLISVKNIN